MLKIFVSVVIRDIGLYFLFLVISLSGFGIRVILTSKNALEIVLTFGRVKEVLVFVL